MNTQFQHSRTVALAFLLLLCSLALNGCIIEPNPSPNSEDGNFPGTPNNVSDFAEPEAPGDKCSDRSEAGQFDEGCPLGNAENTCDDAECGPDCGGYESGDSCQEGECVTLHDCTPDCDDEGLELNDGCGGICSPGLAHDEGRLEENEFDAPDLPLENPTDNDDDEIPESK